jgi:hypothetical protein
VITAILSNPDAGATLRGQTLHLSVVYQHDGVLVWPNVHTITTKQADAARIAMFPAGNNMKLLGIFTVFEQMRKHIVVCAEVFGQNLTELPPKQICCP